jgi:hypothetical protein
VGSCCKLLLAGRNDQRAKPRGEPGEVSDTELEQKYAALCRQLTELRRALNEIKKAPKGAVLMGATRPHDGRQVPDPIRLPNSNTTAAPRLGTNHWPARGRRPQAAVGPRGILFYGVLPSALWSLASGLTLGELRFSPSATSPKTAKERPPHRSETLRLAALSLHQTHDTRE